MTARAVRPILADAASRLEAAGVPSPRVDAELLISHVCGMQRNQLALLDELSAEQQQEFESLVLRRCAREPLQHLTSQAHFRHLTLQVGPGVFIPRPETETLVQLAIDELAVLRSTTERRLRVVDLCTGSAAIPLAIASEAGGIDTLGIELSPQAFEWAKRNVQATMPKVRAVDSTVGLRLADATTAADQLSDLLGLVDVVTCNPPYIPDGAIPRDPEVRDHDPAIALFGGADGLDVVRDVVVQSARLLRPGGLLLIEHGDEQGIAGNERGVPAVIFQAQGFEVPIDHVDLAGRPRVTTTRRLSIET
ncbi:MAG TPA: peptide chain release factor N(5)-glutamine methyltransferase [Actinobacteria bacterium]|nr:peptide chain release factor N(5)-glutamine methyltransferase [Actinomycetota bacterium]